jgi:hypothetical protein
MKISLPIVGLLFAQCLGYSVFAQGVVLFSNSDLTDPPDRLVHDVAGQPLVGTNFLAQLYYGSTGTPESSLSAVASPPRTFRDSTTSAPGTWQGASRTLTGFPPGSVVSLQVRVWGIAAGATWEEAVARGFDGSQYGTSSVFSYIVPPLSGPAGQWNMHNFEGFTLVPEPSLALLGMIGIVGLCFWRRGRP